MMLLDLGLLLLFAAPRLAGAAVVGLTADLEMWPQDGEYLNITATAAALVRGSALSLRYSGRRAVQTSRSFTRRRSTTAASLKIYCTLDR